MTAQLSVELWPLVMVDGAAVNDVITGAAPELLELELLEEEELEDELELLELELELEDELELLELEDDEELELGVVTLTAAVLALSLLAAS